MKKIIFSILTVSSLLFQGEVCFASQARDFYNYELKRGHQVVYRGTTNDLERREGEHRRAGKDFTHMNKVGIAKTEQGARAAERQSLETYRRSHQGRNPEYNRTNHG